MDHGCDRKRKRDQTTLDQCGFVSMNPRRTTLEMIISGGQTGADRAALDAARQLGLETGGWAPRDYLTMNGPDPSLERYGLKQMPSPSYEERSKRNVDMSTGTVAFRRQHSPGTDNTIGYCIHGQWTRSKSSGHCRIEPYRPVLVIDASKWNDGGMWTDNTWQSDGVRLRTFIMQHKIRVLNVCGHREFGDGAWTNAVESFLFESLRVLLDK